MSDILITFLTGRIPQELINQYLRVYDILSVYEKEDSYDMLEAYLMDLDNMDIQSTIDTIHTFHIDQLVNIITEYGITLHDDYSIIDLLEIIDSLMVLENYEDSDDILNLLDTDEDDVITICDILDVCSLKDSVYFMEFIKGVSPDLLLKIQENAINNKKVEIVEEEENTDIVKRKDIVNKLKKLKDNPEYNQLFVFDSIKNGLRLNLPFYLYLDVLKDELFKDPIIDKVIARNISLLGLISKDDDYIKNLDILLLKHIGDLPLIASIQSLVRTYYSEIEK